jgi:integrase
MLTDIKIKNLKAKNKVYRLLDYQGLYLEVAVSGSKNWVHRYTLNKRSTMTIIGYYPTMSLAEARQAKDKNKALMKQGIDPQQHKKDQINEGATFNKMFFEWHDFKKDDWSVDYADDVIKRAKMYLLPYIGNKPMSTIDSKTMRILLKQIERKGIIDTLQKIRSIASRVFKYSVGLDIIKSDPTRDLSTDIFKRKKTVHYATITNPVEIGGLLRAIENYKWSYAVGTALKIAPHVFLRPSELAGLTWDEIDFTNKLIRIDASRMKMDRAHIVPMSNQVLSTLNDLHLIDVSSKFLFPSPRGASRHISPESLRAGLRRLGFTNDDITTHGFRHMASTQLNELGFNSDVIERQLAHCESNKVRAAYNHAELLQDRIAMMQSWSDQLDKLRNQHN